MEMDKLKCSLGKTLEIKFRAQRKALTRENIQHKKKTEI
jgi:hypothetical protein